VGGSSTSYALRDALFDGEDTVAELLLGGAEVLVGVAQVLDFVVELLLDLRQLLCGEASEVDWWWSASGSRPSHRRVCAYFADLSLQQPCCLGMLHCVSSEKVDLEFGCLRPQVPSSHVLSITHTSV